MASLQDGCAMTQDVSDSPMIQSQDVATKIDQAQSITDNDDNDSNVSLDLSSFAKVKNAISQASMSDMSEDDVSDASFISDSGEATVDADALADGEQPATQTKHSWSQKFVSGFRKLPGKSTDNKSQAKSKDNSPSPQSAQNSSQKNAVNAGSGSNSKGSLTSSFTNLAIFDALSSSLRKEALKRYMMKGSGNGGTGEVQSNSKPDTGAPGKSASMDNINQLVTAPPKSILKKRDANSGSKSSVSTVDTQTGEVVKSSKIEPQEQEAKNQVKLLLGQTLTTHSSPNLHLLLVDTDAQSQQLPEPQMNQMKQSGSVKSIQFKDDDTRIIETHSKVYYNRKPGNDLTFKKLTPQLRDEIRSELNQFKKYEMSVHEDSTHHTYNMGISRDSRHKRSATGAKRAAYRKKRKFELGRQPAMTKLGARKVHTVRTMGGNTKHRALRLETGNFSWGSEAITRKTRIIDVVYNASNNELVRTKTLVKNAIVQIDAAPFRQWWEAHYGEVLGKKKRAQAAAAAAEESKQDGADQKKQSSHVKRKIESRKDDAHVEAAIDDQFVAGRLLACISSRPGQTGRCDGYILEGKELEFYIKKLKHK
ncbi:hypothetical protein MIR68_005737 [Amoeboaphelidium protococcarum]|nr:hypothetical protein MIR68_005737 [Amoeboaphelidium protococcarum]